MEWRYGIKTLSSFINNVCKYSDLRREYTTDQIHKHIPALLKHINQYVSNVQLMKEVLTTLNEIISILTTTLKNYITKIETLCLQCLVQGNKELTVDAAITFVNINRYSSSDSYSTSIIIKRSIKSILSLYYFIFNKYNDELIQEVENALNDVTTLIPLDSVLSKEIPKFNLIKSIVNNSNGLFLLLNEIICNTNSIFQIPVQLIMKFIQIIFNNNLLNNDENGNEYTIIDKTTTQINSIKQCYGIIDSLLITCKSKMMGMNNILMQMILNGINGPFICRSIKLSALQSLQYFIDNLGFPVQDNYSSIILSIIIDIIIGRSNEQQPSIKV